MTTTGRTAMRLRPEFLLVNRGGRRARFPSYKSCTRLIRW